MLIKSPELLCTGSSKKVNEGMFGGKNNNNTVLPLTLWVTQIKKPFIFSGCVSPQKVCSWQPLIGKRKKRRLEF